MSQPGNLVKQPIRLLVHHRGEKLTEHVFQHSPIRVGRLMDNDIILPFDFVSRYHCELRFENGRWLAVDLGSKNGIQTDAQGRAREVSLDDQGEFRIQEASIKLIYEDVKELSITFAPRNESATIIGEPENLPERIADRPAEAARQAAAVRQVAADHEHSVSHHEVSANPFRDKGPLIEVDLDQLLLVPHRAIPANASTALQMVTSWHDQVLDVREVPIGCPLRLEFLGHNYKLGVVKKDKTKIKVPKGAVAIADSNGDVANKQLFVHPNEPVAFRFNEGVLISIRYVPKSYELARSSEWVDQPLVDPLLASGAAHGVVALATLFASPHKPPAPKQEPERFAQIIVQATPIPVAALEPTPTPTPMATPEPTPLPPQPTPEPPKIAKPKEPEKKKLKVVVDNKKRREVAEMRKEDPGREHDKPVEVAKVLDVPPAEAPQEAPPPAPEPPVPTATPLPFNAKSVGALKMLSALPVGPASEVANVEKIQISRSPTSASGSLMGREVVTGTGEMLSKLSQSANGAGRADSTAGVAVGKNTGGKYQMAGLAGKAGNRKIRGTVLGGATYSELTKNEGLTREQVMQVVAKHQAQIQMCYERSLMKNPDIHGRAEFEWEISPQGQVNSVRVKEATLTNGEDLLTCVKGVFASMKFPSAKNGESTTPTIGLPFGRL